MEKIRKYMIVIGITLLSVMALSFFLIMFFSTLEGAGAIPVMANPMAKGGHVMPIQVVVTGVIVILVLLYGLIVRIFGKRELPKSEDKKTLKKPRKGRTT